MDRGGVRKTVQTVDLKVFPIESLLTCRSMVQTASGD